MTCRRYRIVIHEHDKPPFDFLCSVLEAGEVWSVVVAALRLLDRERDWSIEIKAVREVD